MSEEHPRLNPNTTWKVNTKERVTACDNRPGLKRIYLTALGVRGEPLRGVKVRFDTELSEGIAYDHRSIWGLTDENGYLEWDHLGIPTRYVLYMEDDETPLVENIRTDLGKEYCGRDRRPVNRPGVYSYRIEVQKKGEGEELEPPVISGVHISFLEDDGDEGYARAVVSFETDVVAEARAHYSLYFEGGPPGSEMQPVCDPYSVGGWHSGVSPAGVRHELWLPKESLWYSREQPKCYCMQIVAWRPGQRHWPGGKGYSGHYEFWLAGPGF